LDTKTSTYYSRNAEQLAGKYATVLRQYEEHLITAFAKAHKILDVGCGTGRDLAWLLRMGKDAYGVDPSKEMLGVARSCLAQQGLSGQGRLFEGELPGLNLFNEAEFDGVLCSAVLMHLPEEEIFDAVYTLRRIIRPGGSLVISVPVERADVDPQTRRDAYGRLFTELPPPKLHLLFERVGFSIRESTTVADSLARDGIRWSVTEFTRLDESTERPLHLVESILNRDKKDATYKLALFRALAEIAQTQNHLADFTPEGKVKIPVQSIADKWMLYYWPIFESEVFICQRTGEARDAANGVAIRRPLEALINSFRASGGMSGFHTALFSGKLTNDAERLWQTARAKFQQTIWNMPVRHAGGGDFEVFQYDRNDKSVCMDANLWRELCLTGSWIQDATVLRWAELTEQLSKGAVKASQVIDCLLAIPDPARNVNDARGYFSKLAERVCVWSDRPLGGDRFDVDHAMPFSLWRNNDLWNLFPTAPGINGEKSDKLPTYRLLNQRRDAIIGSWRGIEGTMGERFRREAQTLLGRDPFESTNWEVRLFSRFVEAFEITAAQRGVPRWETGIIAEAAPVLVRPTPSSVRYVEDDLPLSSFAIPNGPVSPIRYGYAEIAGGAFKTHLPIVGSFAAGSPFHGFLADSLDSREDLDWIAVPPHLAKPRRFLVRVAGDSMAPTLQIGDFVVFEFPRNPLRDHEIVIANLPEFGSDSPGTEAIKRVTQDATHWIYESDNPTFESFRVSKSDIAYPILGTMVEKI
jgi:ubiquinone/menaquinone biosynthesis C-methylase UbiE/SOS-response transcriptional repressor LexA